ncbi:MAG: response regulator transcription factor [Verrucomicrobiae bacterium]|nr:response regulator transcription factor [Verrucomicrobiae bacterium]
MNAADTSLCRTSLKENIMTQRKLILVAEDEADTAKLLQYHLQRHGYRASVAPDGLTALNDIVENRPDLVILDLMLPQLHGLEICRLVKASPVIRQVPILILTALASTDTKVDGFKNGADDYLTKPFDMPELLARVDSLLKRAAA